jgi:hypothetical protein
MKSMRLHIVLSQVMLLLILTSPLSVYGESVIDWIIQNNPELKEMRSLNSSILNMLKVEAKAHAGYGRLNQEGASTVEKAESSYFVGITASMPIISKEEITKRNIEYKQKERLLRQEVSEILSLYTGEVTFLKKEKEILDSLYKEILWVGKRVEAGIDNQKEYNQKMHEYNGRLRDYEKRKEAIKYIREKILSYVDEKARGDLEKKL